MWGLRYVDELVCRDRDTNAGTAGLEERLYALQDANFNVTAVVDTGGAVLERYRYTPYGERTVLDDGWDVRAASSYDWTNGHQGLAHDGESGLVYNRNRVLHPLVGRFLQRDPLDYMEGTNLSQYVRSNPVGRVDPPVSYDQKLWMTTGQ